MWGLTYPTYLKPITTLQKRIARIMTLSEPVSNSEPFLKSLNLLKFNDIIIYIYCGKLVQVFTLGGGGGYVKISGMLVVSLGGRNLTQSFNHREIITKQLFCFQLNWKVWPKKSSKSLNSSFLSAISTKQPTSRNLTALHPGKLECSLSGKYLPRTKWIFLYKSLTRLK